MTPPPEKREGSWDYADLAKKYDELIMAGEGLRNGTSTLKDNCQTLQNSVFAHQKENEELKVKNESLEVRIQELKEIFSAVNHPPENETGREALESAMQTNEELVKEREDLQRQRDDVVRQNEDWEHTVSVRNSEITDHLATIDELQTRLGAEMERVHQYEFRDNPDTSEGGEDTILSLANRTADLHLQPEDHTSTPYEERLKQLEAELARKEDALEAATGKLSRCGNERMHLQLQSMRELERALKLRGKNDTCKKDCEELKRRLCKLAGIVRSHNRALGEDVRDLMADVDCDEGCICHEREGQNKDEDEGGGC